MKHKHHIIPRHMGGSDDPSNVVYLTVEEHAEAHRILFEQYGHWEDEIAWKGLSGMIGKEEIIRRCLQEGGNRRMELHGNPWTGTRTKFNFAENEQFRTEISELAKSPEAIAKRKKTFAKIKHQQGKSNSQYGTTWITNGKETKKINKNAFIPEGWHKGRKLSS